MSFLRMLAWPAIPGLHSGPAAWQILLQAKNSRLNKLP